MVLPAKDIAHRVLQSYDAGAKAAMECKMEFLACCCNDEDCQAHHWEGTIEYEDSAVQEFMADVPQVTCAPGHASDRACSGFARKCGC